jgi:hypothetical protein
MAGTKGVMIRISGDVAQPMFGWAGVACSALALLTSLPAAAADIDTLYQGHAIVTGQGEPNRLAALPSCLEEVLVKLSGDPHLAGDPRLEPLKRDAKDDVASYSYHDRMAGIPTHDEQGTRDRPYDLTVSFDRSKVDAALRAIGSAPWLEARPRVAVFVAMRHGTSGYLVASEGDQGVGERQSLAAAAQKRGIPILLPTRAELAQAHIAATRLPGDAAGLARASRLLGTDVALSGELTWVDRELGWAAAWSLAERGRLHRWTVRGVTFDEAFRNAMGGTAQVLSGHGDPR